MPTPNMGLTVPVVQGTVGPQYASQINDDLSTIDSHNHTAGRGSRVPTAGLEIDADVDFNGNRLTDVKSMRLADQPDLGDEGGGNNALFASDGNLYFNNGDALSVQVTDGSGIAATGIGGFGGDYVAAAAKAIYDSVTGTYTFTNGFGVRSRVAASDLNASGLLTVTGAATLAATLAVAGKATLTDELDVTGNTRLRSDLTIDGQAIVNLTFTSNQVITARSGIRGDTGLPLSVLAALSATGIISGAQITTNDVAAKVNTPSTSVTLYTDTWRGYISDFSGAYGVPVTQTAAGIKGPRVSATNTLWVPLTLPREGTLTGINYFYAPAASGAVAGVATFILYRRNMANGTLTAIDTKVTSSFVAGGTPVTSMTTGLSEAFTASSIFTYHVQCNLTSGNTDCVVIGISAVVTINKILEGVRG